MSEPALECENLSKKYASGNVALEDITLNLDKGRVHVILGPNGAGKTTFLRIATTEIAPSGGTVDILGYDVKRQREQIVAKIGLTSSHE